MPKMTVDIDDDEFLVALTGLPEYEGRSIESILLEALENSEYAFMWRVIEAKNG